MIHVLYYCGGELNVPFNKSNVISVRHCYGYIQNVLTSKAILPQCRLHLLNTSAVPENEQNSYQISYGVRLPPLLATGSKSSAQLFSM